MKGWWELKAPPDIIPPDRVRRAIALSCADLECKHGFLPMDPVVTCDCWDEGRIGAALDHPV